MRSFSHYMLSQGLFRIFFTLTSFSLSFGTLRPSRSSECATGNVAFVLLLFAGSTGCFLRLISGTNIMIDGPGCYGKNPIAWGNVPAVCQCVAEQQLMRAENPRAVGGKLCGWGKVTADSQGFPSDIPGTNLAKENTLYLLWAIFSNNCIWILLNAMPTNNCSFASKKSKY